MALLSLQNASYEYQPGLPAVESINLEVDRGENIAIIGQNGAGKTTTVKMINGLLKPGRGDVIVDGMNTREHTTAQVSRRVGYVFQNPDDQIFHSSVHGEVEYGPRKMKVDPARIKKLINYSLKWTGLQEHRYENPFNLPFSTRKFITIASILAMDVDVVILDEPTAGQDLVGIQLLEAILTELQRRGKTIITITHDMQFVVRNFRKVIVMANSKIIKTGTPQEIFWDFDCLSQAMLKQPYISALCRNLGIPGNIVTIEEAVAALCSGGN